MRISGLFSSITSCLLCHQYVFLLPMGTCVSRLSTILIGFVGFAAMTLFAETARGMWHLLLLSSTWLHFILVEGPLLLSSLHCCPLCSRPRVGKSELKGLVRNSPPRKAQDMGSIALLSPVRADGRLTNQLGAAKVSSTLLAGHFPNTQHTLCILVFSFSSLYSCLLWSLLRTVILCLRLRICNSVAGGHSSAPLSPQVSGHTPHCLHAAGDGVCVCPQ